MMEDAGHEETGVRLEIKVVEKGCWYSVRLDSDDCLKKVFDYLEKEGERDVVEEIRKKESELVDVTLSNERILHEEGKTLQVCGLWPSAKLEIRPVKVAIRIRCGEEKCRIYIDRRMTIAQAAEAAYQALSPRALPDVPARSAKECRFAVAGIVVENAPDSSVALSLLWERREAILISPSPAVSKKKVGHIEVRCCRICFEEELVDTAASDTQTEAEDHIFTLIKDVVKILMDAFVHDVARRAMHLERAKSILKEAYRPKNEHKLISPCLCDGSMRYVHIDCLNAWRAMAPSSRSHFKCDQCNYKYQIKRTVVASFFTSDLGALSVAFAVLAFYTTICGNLALRFISRASRRRFYYVWLRLPARMIPKSALYETFTLGLSVIALLAFTVYLTQNLITWYIMYIRLRIPFRFASEHLFLLSAWIAAETYELKRARAIIVVGGVIALKALFQFSVKLARYITTKFAERILDVAPEIRSRRRTAASR